METHQVLSCLFIALTLAYAQETHRISQCFKSRGIPRVAFSCPEQHMVHIETAFHGIALPSRRNPTTCTPNPGHPATNCSYCDGDCVDESMNLVYDWSTCIGNRSCARTVMQSYIPSCPGSDKFSDYLQVHYQCIARSELVDICSTYDSRVVSGNGYLVSPDYPAHYPANQDCECRLRAETPGSRITLTIYDLLLETKNGRCRADWLMLRQGERKHRHCGAIATGAKNVTTEGSTVAVQLHTDASDNNTQNFQYFTRKLKGFWIHYSASSSSAIQLSCRRLRPTDRQVKEIEEDDALFEVNTVSSGADTPAMPPSRTTDRAIDGNMSSTVSSSVTTESLSSANEGGLFHHNGAPAFNNLTVLHLITIVIIICLQSTL